MGAIFGSTRHVAQRRPVKRPSYSFHDAKKHPRQIEAGITQRVVNYIKKEFPNAIVIADYAAGANLDDKQRQKMRALRSEDGQPDISVDFSSRGFHGLRLELKKEGEVIFKKDGSLRKNTYKRKYYKQGGQLFVKTGDHNVEQYNTLKKYRSLGYFADYAIGYEAAIRTINWYFERPEQSELF